MLDATAAALTGPGFGRVLTHRDDITAEGAAERIVVAALAAFGHVDILINNAGVSMARAFEAVSVEDWRADFEVKVWAAMELTRKVLPEMRKRRSGRVINVTNLDGRTPGAGKMPTSVARAAGIAFTKGLSKDLAGENILVNTVCIGFIKSGQHERRYSAANPDAEREGFVQQYADDARKRGIPMGRVGEGAEAGDVIAFLASERASYITGVAINIDGGLSSVV